MLCRAHLCYPAAHLVIEFDGGNHRDRLVTDNRRQTISSRRATGSFASRPPTSSFAPTP
jgi:very-short-patch-repair endonuclease